MFAKEADWHVASPYPPIGRVAIVDFGSAAFRLNFTDNKAMSFEDTSGAFQGVKDTVQYTAVEVSRNRRSADRSTSTRSRWTSRNW